MRIKIGDHWFEVLPNMPIMLELTAADRANIAAMAEDCTRYAAFHRDDKRNALERSAWMDEGAAGAVEQPRPRRQRNRTPAGATPPALGEKP